MRTAPRREIEDGEFRVALRMTLLCAILGGTRCSAAW